MRVASIALLISISFFGCGQKDQKAKEQSHGGGIDVAPKPVYKLDHCLYFPAGTTPAVLEAEVPPAFRVGPPTVQAYFQPFSAGGVGKGSVLMLFRYKSKADCESGLGAQLKGMIEPRDIQGVGEHAKISTRVQSFKGVSGSTLDESFTSIIFRRANVAVYLHFQWSYEQQKAVQHAMEIDKKLIEYLQSPAN